MNRYSALGSAEFDQRVEAILAGVAHEFDAQVDHRSVKALVLGGGYGRGEGGVLHKDGKEELYNDLDIFVFTRKLDLVGKLNLQKQIRTLHHTLSERHHLDIDFSTPKDISKLSHEPFSLMMYDLSCGYKVIWGKLDLKLYLPPWKASDMPREEAVKLLLNRAMGLFFSREKLKQEHPDTDYINRNIHKAWQALGEAILISERVYNSSTPKKISRLQVMGLDQYTAFSGFRDRFEESMQFKLSPEPERYSLPELKDRLDEIIPVFQGVYYRIWAVLSGMSIKGQRSYKEAVCAYHRENTGTAALAKNLLLNLRDRSWQPGNLSLAYPRQRLYLALPWLLFGSSEPSPELCQILGVPQGQTRETLQDRFVKLWQRYN
ncbi:MAG: hypothetical protein V3576_07890 [Candidatus Cloacimonadota bacterium]